MVYSTNFCCWLLLKRISHWNELQWKRLSHLFNLVLQPTISDELRINWGLFYGWHARNFQFLSMLLVHRGNLTSSVSQIQFFHHMFSSSLVTRLIRIKSAPPAPPNMQWFQSISVSTDIPFYIISQSIISGVIGVAICHIRQYPSTQWKLIHVDNSPSKGMNVF